LREILEDWHPSEIAELIGELPDSDQALFFRILPRKQSVETFEYLDLDAQHLLIKSLGKEEVSAVLNEMSPDDRTSLLEDLPGTIVRQLMELLSPEERKVAQQLLLYPEDSVGRLMTPDYLTVHEQWIVQNVYDHIRNYGRDTESISTLYVVNEKGILLDDIRIHDCLLSRFDRPVDELMDRSALSLLVTDSKDSAVNLFRKYDRNSLPVVDAEGVMLGIVTVDDALDVVVESSTEDIQKFGGVEVLEYPYLATPFFEMVKKRASWLVILFFGEMLTATAMGYFEGEIAKAVVLALFVPLIISSGGNSGSQAATLAIRAMALEEIRLLDWKKVLSRELVSGLCLGLILGSIGFVRIAGWSMFSAIYGPHWILVAITVSAALIGVVLWGTLIGSMLPFLLRKLGFDPAASSAPFVATLVDVTGLIIYFSVASLLLRGSLL